MDEEHGVEGVAEFHPLPWRVLLPVMAIVTLAVGAGLALCAIAPFFSMPEWPIFLVIIVWYAGYLLVRFSRRHSRHAVYVGRGHISVASPDSPQSIALADLDRHRSAHRSLGDRLFGVQRLYSTTGDTITVARWALGPQSVRRLLDTLGMRGSGKLLS